MSSHTYTTLYRNGSSYSRVGIMCLAVSSHCQKDLEDIFQFMHAIQPHIDVNNDANASVMLKLCHNRNGTVRFEA